MHFVVPVIGVIAILLGGLWALQGLGIVHMQPILCVAECEAIEGTSLTWAIVGVAMVSAGIGAIVYSLGRRRTEGTGRRS